MKHLLTGFCLALSSCAIFADSAEKMPLVLDDGLTEQEIAYAKEIVEADGFEEMLYGGKPVEDGELPMVYNVGFCTTTLVGPETMFIASHCVSNGSKASFIYKGVRRTGVCTRHPQYNDRTVQYDWALCKFSPAIEDAEAIYSSLEPKLLSVGSKVILNGFGKGSSNGRLHWGKMPIVRISGDEYITQGSTVLGSGDSGGSLFNDMDDLRKGPFFTVGCNSRAGSGMSIFNYTAHEKAQSFFKSYADSQNVKICGINLVPCKNLAGSVEPPPPPKDPVHCFEEKRMFDLMVNKMKLFEGFYKTCAK